MLKIAYLGNMSERIDFTTEHHIKKTLELLGHTVTRIQEDEVWAEEVPNLVAGHDLFLWTRTPGFLRGDAVKMIREIRGNNIPSISYHLDLYCSISREASIPTDPFWKSDYCFSPDGDPISAEKFKNYGVNHFYMPPGVYEPECYLAEPKEEYMTDVLFVGSHTSYHQEWSYRLKLVEWLKLTYGNRFKAYPEQGQPAIRGHELNRLYASAKVVVGDTLCVRRLSSGDVEPFTHEYYFSDRVMETTGRGGMIIHPYIKGLDDCFEDGKHLRFYQYGDFEQLKSLIDYYISEPAARESIRTAGHLHTKTRHTYTNRLQDMLLVVAGYEPKIAEKL